MKLAVPTRGASVDGHFGHCEMYTIFTVDENNNIVNTEILPSPHGCGCKSNIAQDLRKIGVTVMLAGNMGAGAMNVLNLNGIEVVRGCSGEVNIVVEAFLKGNLYDSGVGCQQHEHHHGHGGEEPQCNH